MTEFDYLITELNLLIGFLDVSDENIYNQIKKHDRFNLGITIEQLYDGKYENYASHICSSAFLLGFTHFEHFLTKRVSRFLEQNPDKNDFKVTLKTINEKGEGLNLHLAKEQSRRLTFQEKVKLLEKNIPDINLNLTSDLKHANDIRNCLMHNNGIADDRFCEKYIAGEKIILTSLQVHVFGVKTRQLAYELWTKI